jgi:hypothetical protein
MNDIIQNKGRTISIELNIHPYTPDIKTDPKETIPETVDDKRNFLQKWIDWVKD